MASERVKCSVGILGQWCWKTSRSFSLRLQDTSSVEFMRKFVLGSKLQVFGVAKNSCFIDLFESISVFNLHKMRELQALQYQTVVEPILKHWWSSMGGWPQLFGCCFWICESQQSLEETASNRQTSAADVQGDMKKWVGWCWMVEWLRALIICLEI